MEWGDRPWSFSQALVTASAIAAEVAGMVTRRVVVVLLGLVE